MTPQDITLLFHDLFEPIYRYVYFRIGHKQDSEALVSLIFEKVIAKQESYSIQEHASIRSWVFRIAHNTIVDHYRTRKTTDAIDDIEISTEHSLEKELDITIETERVRIFINRLPERQREILLLRYHAQLNYAEIGSLLDIEPKSASSLLSKALTQVRDDYNAQLPHL
ncbi:MAG: RNA polymerase sigma factor [Candidatus Kerfeldbacteria bacterium]|nr:RNA polymerase sigma factor [Candidatus Kerfeldbacteria bacterium]